MTIVSSLSRQACRQSPQCHVARIGKFGRIAHLQRLTIGFGDNHRGHAGKLADAGKANATNATANNTIQGRMDILLQNCPKLHQTAAFFDPITLG